MIAVLIVSVAGFVGLMWLVYWRRQAREWDLLLTTSAINREKVIKASIASDPIGIFRAVLQVVGIVVVGLLTAL